MCFKAVLLAWLSLFPATRTALSDPSDVHVFNEGQISTIKVTLTPENYKIMLSSRTELGPDAVHQWVPVTVEFNELTLSNVAMRIKGNNSLAIKGLAIPI
jgi:spore coat protein CotH